MLSRLRMVSMCMLWLLPISAAVAQQVVTLVRTDQQAVPVSVYAHKQALCRGVALISPGAGGSEQGYAYLGTALAELGYLSLVLGHAESGRAALRAHRNGQGMRGALADLITDGRAYQARLLDIAAAKAWGLAHCSARETVLIGHSMGAATTLIEAGARNQLGVQGGNAFDAYIAMSPQGVGAIFPAHAWAEIQRPVLTLTGTRDQELGGATWQVRTEPYLDMPAGCKWLGVIDGATHMHFAGHGSSRRTEALVTQAIAAFLDGVRRGDCKLPNLEPGMTLQAK